MMIFSYGFNDTAARGEKIGIHNFELEGDYVIGGSWGVHISGERHDCLFVSDSVLSGEDWDFNPRELAFKGVGGVASVDGVVGFILLDKSARKADIVGDYLGRVPLYYYFKKNLFENRLLVASELKCFYGLPLGDVKLLGMGERLVFEGGKLAVVEYSTVRREHDFKEVTDDDALGKTRTLLEHATEKFVKCAKRIGDMCVFLSGGVDSTVIAAIAKQIKPDLVAYTFSVGDDKKNDLYFARLAAERLGIELREVVVTKEEVFEHLAEIVYLNEDSNWTQITSAVGQYFLAKRAGADGFKIALCGDMSDEIFASYPQIERWSWRDEQYVVARDRLISKAWVNANRSVKVLRGAGNMLYFDPFTDRAFLEFASNVPPRFKDGKLNGKRVNKWLLRSAFTDIIPVEIAVRPKGCQGTVTNVDELFVDKKDLIKSMYDEMFNNGGRIVNVKL